MRQNWLAVPAPYFFFLAGLDFALGAGFAGLLGFFAAGAFTGLLALAGPQPALLEPRAWPQPKPWPGADFAQAAPEAPESAGTTAAFPLPFPACPSQPPAQPQRAAAAFAPRPRFAGGGGGGGGGGGASGFKILQRLGPRPQLAIQQQQEHIVGNLRIRRDLAA